MNEKINFEQSLSRYCVLLGLIGLTSCLCLFPRGMFYGFMCSVVGLVTGILAKRGKCRGRSAGIGIALCILSLLSSLILYSSMLSLYTFLRDPVAGPQITELFFGAMNSYGISPGQFVSMLNF